MTATSPRRALEIVQAHPTIDLLLSDLVMPALNGLELARQARAHSPNLRCLFMSSHPKFVRLIATSLC